MALLLGAFLILGLQPGPEFLAKHHGPRVRARDHLRDRQRRLERADVRAVEAAGHVTRIPGHVLAPILLVLVVIGTYAAREQRL